MKAIELFAGAGGLGMGVASAGFTPVEIVEWNRWCCDTLRENRARGVEPVAHWPEPVQGDVRAHDFRAHAGRVDLVAGGPPCQPFSLGGKHRAHLDARDMWPQAVRALREIKPRAFLFENVRGLTRPGFAHYLSYIVLQLRHPELTACSDEDWASHLRRLEGHQHARTTQGLSYQVAYRVLNAADYGVPQKRFRADLGMEARFPEATHSAEALRRDQASGAYWERHRVARAARRNMKGVAGETSLLAWRTTRDALADLPDPEREPAKAAGFRDHAFQPGARARAPLSGHGVVGAADTRTDPVALLEAQNATREPDLVPVRHGRMMASPFTFYRGAAKIMASDLADTPNAGLTVQLCGDAHLSNFGFYGSPERTLVFDLNDFDETLPGPFEYDVKRMAASFTIAARNNGFSKADRLEITQASVRAYREAMAEFAEMSLLEVWYARLSEQDLRDLVDSATKFAAAKKLSKAETAKALKRAKVAFAKAHSRDSLQALSKLAEVVDGRYQIVSQPPIVVPSREFGMRYDIEPAELVDAFHEKFHQYRMTLEVDRRALLERYEFIDLARKVVGVGSVGTRVWIILLHGPRPEDVLFLQAKEAEASVLERFTKKSTYANQDS